MATRVGQRALSEGLREFVAEHPYERESILDFVEEIADSLSPNSVVLDIGAGPAPYRELFEHCRYVTSDWQGSVHEAAGEVDLVAPADALPLDSATADLVLLTQVLEHVPTPAAVLAEAARLLRPGGELCLTVPFVWELHELPHDFWRFTPASLERLLGDAGFDHIRIAPRSDCFATVAQLMRNLRWAMGRAADGLDPQRLRAADLLDEAAERIAALAELDAQRALPLGWSVRARRP